MHFALLRCVKTVMPSRLCNLYNPGMFLMGLELRLSNGTTREL